MINAIRERALPAFEVCSSKDSLAAQIMERHEITCVPDWAVDIALWVGNMTAAEKLARSQLASRPDLLTKFNEFWHIEAEAPSVQRPIDRLHCLAWVARKHRLRVPSAA